MAAKRIFPKNKTVIAILLFLTILIAPLILSSCENAATITDIYTSSPFLMEIEGEIDGNILSARIYIDPTQHRTKEVYEKMIITFSSPENLDGITVTYLSNSKTLVRLEDLISQELPSDGISKLYEIFVPRGELTRLKKEEDGKTVAEYENAQGKISYVFDKYDRLTVIKGEYNKRFFHFDVKVVENKENKY